MSAFDPLQTEATDCIIAPLGLPDARLDAWPSAIRRVRMSGFSVLFLATMAASSAPTEAQRTCAKEVGAVAAAYRLAALPEDIRADLAARKNLLGNIGD